MMSVRDALRASKPAPVLALLLALTLLFAPHRAFADRALERALAAKDPKAVQRVIKEAATAEAHLLMQAAVGLLESGQRGLRISAMFRRIHLARMAEIEERLGAMLESWIVK